MCADQDYPEYSFIFIFIVPRNDVITSEIKWFQNEDLCSVIDGKIRFSVLLM